MISTKREQTRNRLTAWEESNFLFRELYHIWLRWSHGRARWSEQKHVVTIARENYMELRHLLTKHVLISEVCARKLPDGRVQHYAYILGYNP